jgi:ComF family protein
MATEWLPTAPDTYAPPQPAPRKLPLRSTLRSSLAATRPLAGRLARACLDLLYPPSCLACQSAVSAPGTLCTGCWSRMRFIERPYCERLGTPFARDLGPGLLSPEAIAHPPVWARARAVAVFDDGPVRQLIYRLKYRDRMEVAGPLGLWMARAGADLLAEADLLVPVPLHRLRLASRRFNQAMVLAEAVSRATGVPADGESLERTKPTAPQVGLSRLQRAMNVQGAFRLREERRIAIAGRRIVLIDDVLTSGATTNAAARTLLRAGAAQVDLLVFARVVTGEALL